MKPIKEIFSEILESMQTYVNVSKNIKDEIKNFDFSSKNEIEKKYVKVLKDIKINVDKRKKLHKKEDVMSWNQIKNIIVKSKNFKIYNQDKMTDISDFEHIMD